MPERKLIVSPRADADAVEIAAAIAVDNPSAAARFIAALANDYSTLQAFPGLGRARTFRGRGLTGLRSRAVTRFSSWLVFYRVTSDAVQIVRVIHGARDLRRTLRG